MIAQKSKNTIFLMPADIGFLQLAIQKSRTSLSQGGFPAGAIIVKNHQVIGEGISDGTRKHDPTNHAEIAAIRSACQTLSTNHLISSATLYASLEPCAMCLEACKWASVEKIVYVCAKNQVSSEFFEGQHELLEINAQNHKPIELIHQRSLEQEALAIIKEWQKKISH